MKKLCVSMLLGIVAVGFYSQPAQAVKVFGEQFEEVYVDKDANPEFAEAVKDRKCNVCHFGKSKKDYNAYGVALAQYLDEDDYKSSRVRKEREQVNAEILEALKKVEAEKAPCGSTWGELLKAGKLPPDEEMKLPGSDDDDEGDDEEDEEDE